MQYLTIIIDRYVSEDQRSSSFFSILDGEAERSFSFHFDCVKTIADIVFFILWHKFRPIKLVIFIRCGKYLSSIKKKNYFTKNEQMVSYFYGKFRFLMVDNNTTNKM